MTRSLYRSLPDDLKAMKNDIERLHAEEEQAGLERDYERAAEKKAERLRIEQDFNTQREKWEADHQLDEVVDVDDIAEVVNQWTGIPLTQMMESEAEKLLHMEDRLHERIIGQDEAIHAISSKDSSNNFPTGSNSYFMTWISWSRKRKCFTT